MITITPRTPTIVVVGTTLQPLAHGDPDHPGQGNTSPFRRRDQVLPSGNTNRPVTQQDLNDLLQYLAPHQSICSFTHRLTAPQYIAAGSLAIFLDLYNGEGQLDSMDRYRRLGDRALLAARRQPTFSQFWTDLCRSLDVGGTAKQHEALLSLQLMPARLARLVCEAIDDHGEMIFYLAREWHTQGKAAKKDGGLFNLSTPPNFSVGDLPVPKSTVIRPVPAITGNSVRHSLVREPGLVHMLRVLGCLREALPGPVASMLSNGGGIAAKAVAPTNEAQIGEMIRQKYPFIELLGGCTPAFMLPAGMLDVEPYLVCSENQDALQRWDITPEHAGEDLISTETLVRHGDSPMPYGSEVLAPGAQIAIGFSLAPYASNLTLGCLGVALREFQANPALGGKEGSGHGVMSLDYQETDAMKEAIQNYEDYLSRHAEELAAGLMNGTFCSGTKVA